MKLIHRQQDQINELEALTGELKRSSAFQAMRAEESARLLKEREAAAAELGELEAEQGEKAQEWQGTMVEAEGLVAESKASYERELAALGMLQRERYQSGFAFNAKINEKANFLRSTANPQIDEAIQFFIEKLEWLRSTGRLSTQRTGGVKRNLFSKTQASHVESNLQGVNDALKYCQEAMKTLEVSKLLPAVDETKIESLKEGVPSIENYTSHEAERPMPGSKVPTFESLLLSEAASDYKTDSLLKRAGKLIATSGKG